MNTSKKNKLIASFGFAIKGFIDVLISERNMKIHVGVLCLVTLGGFYFDISSLEWIACLICYGAVLGAEAFNTAIERLVDAISPEFNPKYGEVKDIASGAVFATVIFAILVGLIIFLPKVIAIFP